MKALAMTAGVVVAAGLAVSANSDILELSVEQGWTSTGNVTIDFDFPTDVASIKSVTIEITHTFQGDLDFNMSGPGGDYAFANSVGGGSDLGVAGSGQQGDEAPYTFVAPGGTGTTGWAPLGGGTTDAEGWGGGGSGAGWTISLDDPVGGDGGYITRILIDYNVPAPGALALLGIAGLAGRRRRRA